MVLIKIFGQSVKKYLLIALIWFILSLIQSFFTEIIDDEAYYWVYSRFLDWGYFDHPPMIALLIKCGTFLFPGELGVRFLPSLMGAGTVFLLLIMLKNEVRNPFLTLLMVAAIPLFNFHVAGFIATPDLPLVFFTTLFFFLYKRYLETDSLLLSLLLSTTIALMLYSKYHAFLVLGLTLFSNVSILKKRSFWIMLFVALLLYLPHILWQAKNGFVSFGYHLVQRSRPFKPEYMIEYLGSQILLLGPLTGLILFIYGARAKTRSPFEKTLKINLIGFFLFFLLASLRGHVESHWTAVAFVPLVLLSLPILEEHPLLEKRARILALVSLPLVILVRISLVFDAFPMPLKLHDRFHGKKEYFTQISRAAGNRPVVFTNSYQDASLYWYFSRKPAFSRNNKYYRKNQFDLLDLEASWQGREVFYFPKPPLPGCDTLHTVRGDLPYTVTTGFCQFNRVQIRTPPMKKVLNPGEEIHVQLDLCNPTGDPVCFCDSCSYSPWLVYSLFGKGGAHRAFRAGYGIKLPALAPYQTLPFPVSIKAPDKPGIYTLMFGFGAQGIPAGINGKPVRIEVRSRSRVNSG